MKPKIIVVEDELIIAYDIKSILEQEDYEVIINIVDVEQAITAIEIENPDLVLIDVNLKSNKDGIRIGHYLLQKDTIPFVYITSNSDSATLDKIKDTRPYGFIVKPFKPIDIKSTVYLALNTFKHRKIDYVRSQEEEIINDIPYRIKQTVAYINQHVVERIEINTLAEITKWKKHHFIRIFTKHMNITPYQYILIRKIDKSKILLQDEGISIKEISFELGFLSHSNFCNAFKKITNTTPEGYRNLKKMKQEMTIS